jgi:heme/copper-type cytochrome/quinol oxidase subunit 2
MSSFFSSLLNKLNFKQIKQNPLASFKVALISFLKNLLGPELFDALSNNIKKFSGIDLQLPKNFVRSIAIPFLIFKHLENRLFRSRLKLAVSNKLYTFIHDTKIETIWTVLPIIIVLSIAVPSFILLYALDAALDSVVVIKAIGHQWYWNYECEFSPLLSKLADAPLSICFDSYMVYDSQLKEGQIRLLEVDNPLYIPYRLPVDLIVTSVDVIHSWAVPSLGIKIDGLPGRLNHSGLFIERKGVFYGQCSELCGVNHGFMPIKVVSVSFSDFMDYCYNFALSNGKIVSWGIKSLPEATT